MLLRLSVALLCAGCVVFCLPSAPAPGQPSQADPAVERLVNRLANQAQRAGDQEDRADTIRDLVEIGTAESVAPLVPLLVDPWHHIREVVTLALTEDPGLDNAEALAGLIRVATRQQDPVVRARVASLFARIGANEVTPEVVPALVEWLDDESDDAVKAALCEALGLIGVADEDVTDQLESAGRRGDLAPAAATLALARLGVFNERDVRRLSGRDWREHVALIDGAVAAGQSVAEAVAAGIEARPYQTRIAALEACLTLKETDADAAVEAVVSLYEDDEWQVRATAYRTALFLWDKRVVSALIERLEEEEGRLKLDIYNVLRFYTAQDFGLTAENWRTWWRANNERVVLGDPPQGGPFGVDLTDPPRHEDDTMTASFFDIPVLSDKVVFAIDPSRSMGNDAFHSNDAPRKIDLAAAHIVQAVQALPEDARFNVILFWYRTNSYPPTQDPQVFFPLLVPVRAPQATQQVQTTIAECRPDGRGDFYGAISAAMEIPDVDTIYFLSDGGATAGEHLDLNELAAALFAQNRFKRIAVHTILTGEVGADAETMRTVATAMGGFFKQVNLEEMED